MIVARADFAAADDILREAACQRLERHSAIVVKKSGRVGPVVELTLASLQFADQYRLVDVQGEFASNLRRALQSGQPFGSGYRDVVGAFPLGAENPIVVARVRTH